MAWIVSALNLANTIIGVSVLSMPFLLQNVSPHWHLDGGGGGGGGVDGLSY